MPLRSTEPFRATSSTGQELNGSIFRGTWTFVLPDDGTCDLYCEASLFKMRQVRLALGRDMGRLQNLLIVPENSKVNDSNSSLRTTQGNLKVVSATEEAKQALNQLFEGGSSGTFYIVDPLGFVMMRYDNESTSKGILKDMKHLLKVSHIG